jgi:hypothetical protein
VFREAVDLLAKNPFRHLIVADPDGRILGVISDRDVLSAASSYDSETTLAADIYNDAGANHGQCRYANINRNRIGARPSRQLFARG